MTLIDRKWYLVCKSPLQGFRLKRNFFEKPRKAKKFVEIRLSYFCTILYKQSANVCQIKLLTTILQLREKIKLSNFKKKHRLKKMKPRRLAVLIKFLTK